MIDYLKFWLSKQLVEIAIGMGIVLIGLIIFVISAGISKGKKKKDVMKEDS